MNPRPHHNIVIGVWLSQVQTIFVSSPSKALLFCTNNLREFYFQLRLTRIARNTVATTVELLSHLRNQQQITQTIKWNSTETHHWSDFILNLFDLIVRTWVHAAIIPAVTCEGVRLQIVSYGLVFGAIFWHVIHTFFVTHVAAIDASLTGLNGPPEQSGTCVAMRRCGWIQPFKPAKKIHTKN